MCDGGEDKIEDKEEPQNDVKDMCDGGEDKIEDKEEPQNDVKDMSDGGEVKVEDKEEPQNDVKDMSDGGEDKIEDKEEPQNDVKDMSDGGEVKGEDKEEPQNDVKDMSDGGEVKVEDKEEPQNDVKDMSDGGEVKVEDKEEPQNDVKDMSDGGEVKVEDKEEPQNDVKDMSDGGEVKVEDKEEPQNDVKDMSDGGEVKVEDKEEPQNDVKDMSDGGEVKVEDKEEPQNDVKDMSDGGEVKVEDKEEPQNDVKDMSDGGEVSSKDTQESCDDVKLEALVSESDISEVEIIQPNGPKELCGNNDEVMKNDEELQGKTTVKSDGNVDNCKILADVDNDDCSNHMVNDNTAVYLKSGGDEENMNVFDVGFKEGEKEESFKGDFESSVETKQFVSKNEPTGIPHTDEFEKKKVEVDKVDPVVEGVKKCDPTTETECLEKSQFSENFSSSDVVNENAAEGTTQDTVKNGLSSDEIAVKVENDNIKEINELSMITSKTNECLKRGEDETIEK
ncbi:uncharacterized protein DDB_G0290685-like [Xenia sp. Carnegie-2017]|uniref:uncharacterized protein DDB_G0290685-like n=1 Tax=Xenia sp. Carnegie-2017 TaxID=2897299 RepID=UPI001F04ECA8|nr:uncharacterized protein DDB_G0290685-like [Xenia sp. Carnegie-2017]